MRRAVAAASDLDDEVDEEIDEHARSRPFCKAALFDFRDAKGKVLAAVTTERYTKRLAMETLRRRYIRILTEYLRVPGTTYSAWLELGPAAEWDECLSAAIDDAVWNRLCERGLADLR